MANKKWTSEAGPRQTKQAEKALNAIFWEGRTFVELSGVIGGEESRCSLTSPFSPPSDAACKAYESVGEEFGWTITRKNFKDVIACAEDAVAELQKHRPIVDKRRSPEEEAERKAKLEETRKKQEERRKKAEETEYFDVVETAKLIRPLLKQRFPGIKFSVRSDSYSGGASIDIGWTDGPTGPEVRQVVTGFEGSGFDGMIDLKYSTTSWLLPDGTATWAESQGTTGSAGVDPGYDYPKPHPQARKVQFGADSVSCNRSYSDEVFCNAAWTICQLRGINFEDLEAQAAREQKPLPDVICNARIPDSREWLSQETWRELGDVSFMPELPRKAEKKAKPSKRSDNGSKPELNVNTERHGLELIFPVKPSNTVRSNLKADGWRWSKRFGRWWIKDSETARESAKRFAGSEALA